MRYTPVRMQLAIYTPLQSHVSASWDRPLHGLSYLLLIGFFVLNLRVPAFWLVGFGLVSNVVVIWANNWLMPVSAHAWTASGNPLSVFNARGISDNNVLTGPHTAARMRLAGATHLIDSIAGLPDLVASSG